MVEKGEHEYAELKEFFAFYVERYFNVDNLPPEKRPIASLEAFEKKSMTMAFTGLRQAINDCVEMSRPFNHLEVEKLDSELRTRGIVTLSELRRRFSKDYARIVKRGELRNETEYYLVRNVLDDLTEGTAQERELLEKMLSAYEADSQRVLPRGE